MMKDFTRDYVTEMFKVWALNQKHTLNVKKTKGLTADIAAVDKTFEQLEKAEKGYIVKAVKEVYCYLPEFPTIRNDVTLRARRFSLAVPCSEKQVYEWLKEARRLCAQNRGLRTDEVQRGE